MTILTQNGKFSRKRRVPLRITNLAQSRKFSRAENSWQFEIMPMDFAPISQIMVQNHHFAQIMTMVQNGLFAKSQDHAHGPYESYGPYYF